MQVIGGAFIGVGFLVFILLLKALLKAKVSRLWPMVTGELLDADLKLAVYKGVDSDGTTDQASALNVDFTYSYRVKGQQYTGRRVTFSDRVNKTPGSLKKLLKRYQGKSSIVVYYNPEKPQESVLVPGVSLYNLTPFITAILFLLAGLYIFNLQL